MTAKVRLDKLLVDRGLAPTLEKAAALLLSGTVLMDERLVDKAGLQVKPDVVLRLKGKEGEHPYVSRGGVKLKGAIDKLGVSIRDLVVLDVGASTGGFTDCLLQEGAAKVYALDVGYGQLAWKLRQDDRVVVIERTNIRNFKPQGIITEPIDLATIDASFISLKRVIPPVIPLLAPHGAILALVKPQFEAEKGQVGKNGVVTDPVLHEQILARMGFFLNEIGFEVLGQCPSPIKGPAGNREFFMYARLKQL
ncbi:MAG: 16S/23S rRNA (cytidine-2'-O)-methyltransferase TlyA [Syntrophus sp. SKADARSKE-3]|nr:16S/23S rRNA (cytidine-2'-O)-methyltransferase TlyA [Syntrophus sp. SKADARSKE-3]